MMLRLSARTLRYVSFVALIAFTVGVGTAQADEREVDFNRDIRPIFSDICYKCHGPDTNERQTSWRLDAKDGALAKLDDGSFAIVPGDSTKSVLYQRVSSVDPELRMPPPESHKQLTAEQIDNIKRWIDQGAEFAQHWSFIPPKRPELPTVKNEAWPQTPIDNFILARLEKAGLGLEPEANRETLIRRVTYDLTGLPPTIEEIDAFLADISPNAYEQVVDRLLKSPRFGEHRARYWLDAARYGDTHGLHLDNERSLWPYRDWVINAFNDNMPFDQFTVEQLAGDLLPEPTLDQLVATGFNRCNVTTSEGGSIAEEYRVRYAVDRVEAVGTVWMGLTVGCAVCHDHKFDPVSQQEFYQLFAYYNNVDENPMDGNALLPPPTIKVPSPEEQQQEQDLQQRIAELGQRINQEVARFEYTDPKSGEEIKPLEPQEVVWIDDELPSGAKPQASGAPAGWQWVTQETHPVFSGEKASTRTVKGLGQHFFTAAAPGLKVGAGDTLFAYVYLDPNNPPREIMLQFNDGKWEHRATWGEDVITWGQPGKPSRLPQGALPELGKWVRLEVDAQKVGLAPGSTLNGWAFTQFDGTVYWDKAGIVTKTPQDGLQFESLVAWEQVQREVKNSSLPKPIQDVLKIEPEKRTDAQQRQLRDYFVEHVYAKSQPVFAPLKKELTSLKDQLSRLQASVPGTMIMRDRKEPRDCFVLARGEYDKPDKDRKVLPGVPAVFGSMSDDAPPNRLGLARWLVKDDHPLTARVTVNRFWQQYFGAGLVKTAEDFGSQGEFPTHPDLLDWLATEFVRSGWDVKRLHKLIVMSAAYRQSAHVSSEKLKLDSQNRLISRGPRFRMDGEMIRDTALFTSGLLIEQIGGRSVKPYQPPGLWEAVGYTSSNTARFSRDSGKKLYRRSLYTFWKRTSAPPSMQTFDAPSREACTVSRARTNTPLQALALMNDEQYVEAARKLAARMMKTGGETVDERIVFAFRSATARQPTADELQVIRTVYETHLADYSQDTAAALKLLSVGEAERDESLDPAQLAAWTMVANLILNLDETVTKG